MKPHSVPKKRPAQSKKTEQNRTGFRWTAPRLKAAQLLAEDALTDEAIAAALQVARHAPRLETAQSHDRASGPGKTIQNETAFCWTVPRLLAAQLLAQEALADHEIAAEAKVVRATFARWKLHPNFVAKVSELTKQVGARSSWVTPSPGNPIDCAPGVPKQARRTSATDSSAGRTAAGAPGWQVAPAVLRVRGRSRPLAPAAIG